MRRALEWHTRAGEIGLLLFKLHLLWIWRCLLGGIVLGVFPATAAVYGVVRREFVGLDSDGEPSTVRQQFRALWQQEFRTANLVGYIFVALWAVLLLDRRLLETYALGAIEPALGGLLWLLTMFLSCMSTNVWVLAAHFDETGLTLVRRSAILVLARPVSALLNLVIVGVVASAYYVVPGLVPVFGVAVPAFLSFAYVWSTGVLVRPQRAPKATSRAEGSARPTASAGVTDRPYDAR
jgi:uncharacterized membrane protein YesL